jgi:hypothetical protein
VRTDVSIESEVEAAVAAVPERYGRLDCVVNNAGVGGAFGPITEIEVEDWDYTFAVITRGVFLGIKHAARVMQAMGTPGSIVNTGSIAGLGGGVGPQAYSAAKAAVLNLTRLAAVELAPFRIRVNAVNPGAIATPIHRSAVKPGGELSRVVGERHHRQPHTGRIEQDRPAGVFDVDSGADPPDACCSQVVEGVEECLGPEVEGVVVGQGYAVHAQEREHLGGDGRGAEEERLGRVGPGHAPGGDATFQIDDAEIGFPKGVNHLGGEQGGGRRRRQGLGDAAPQHRVSGEGEPHRS